MRDVQWAIICRRKRSGEERGRERGTVTTRSQLPYTEERAVPVTVE